MRITLFKIGKKTWNAYRWLALITSITLIIFSSFIIFSIFLNSPNLLSLSSIVTSLCSLIFLVIGFFYLISSFLANDVDLQESLSAFSLNI